MKPKELAEIGVPKACVGEAIHAVRNGLQERLYPSKAEIREVLRNVVIRPVDYLENQVFGKLATSLIAYSNATKAGIEKLCNNPHGRAEAWSQWGESDDGVKGQMRNAIELPVTVSAALMPDNHLGYGVPIGGVIAMHNAVSPHAVGVDIACRMKLSILDIPAARIEDVFSPKVDPFIRALTGGTVFGVDQRQTANPDHKVMDMDWNITAVTKRMKDRAWTQLGTSGGGNHFVEFGLFTLEKPDMGLEPGIYLALMSHSGSRGAGKAVCDEYSELARAGLPAELKKYEDLAWLSLDSEAGQEYWAAMNLMGEYAHGNHDVIHQKVSALLGAQIIAGVENHHNFCWKEEHDGKILYVHRKGATPAGEGVLGVIPGSMADPAFVVRGKGVPQSLKSASHGAGRKMSRTKAKQELSWANWKSILKQRQVRVLTCGLDEVPGAYKDIREVMAQQADLVDIVARFDPKIVKMADDGKSED